MTHREERKRRSVLVLPQSVYPRVDGCSAWTYTDAPCSRDGAVKLINPYHGKTRAFCRQHARQALESGVWKRL